MIYLFAKLKSRKQMAPAIEEKRSNERKVEVVGANATECIER